MTEITRAPISRSSMTRACAGSPSADRGAVGDEPVDGRSDCGIRRLHGQLCPIRGPPGRDRSGGAAAFARLAHAPLWETANPRLDMIVGRPLPGTRSERKPAMRDHADHRRRQHQTDHPEMRRPARSLQAWKRQARKRPRLDLRQGSMRRASADNRIRPPAISRASADGHCIVRKSAIMRANCSTASPLFSTDSRPPPPTGRGRDG